MTATTDNKKWVLVAEDDAIVALDLTDQVGRQGFGIRGPFSEAAKAAQEVNERRPDIAILDYHLRDGSVEKLALTLEEQQIPYALVTVSERDRIPAFLSPVGYFEKPFDSNALTALLAEIV